MRALLRQFLRFWPSSLRLQLMIVLLPVVGLPIIATGYMLKLRGHEAIVEEKQVHLRGVGDLLAAHLDAQGGYTGLLAAYDGPPGDRAAQLALLNERLRAYTDEVARVFPEVGVGFFHRGLQAIVTYGPSAQYGDTVGMTIPPEHPGWQVMATRTPMTVNGGLVRGNIMNVMRPIVENDEVVGYIWANELLDAIDRQAGTMRLAVYSMTLLGFALSLAVVYFVIAQLTKDMATIKGGLHALRFDLRASVPPVRGEIGEISEAINDLAQDLLRARSMHQNILDSLADAVITVDAEHRVTYINPAGCALFGCEAAAVVGQSYAALFRPDANFCSLVVDTLETGQEHRGVELDYPLPQRTPHVQVSTSQLFDGRGHQLGAVAVVRDISETHSLRQQVVRADRLAAIGEVAAGIAHELRTPLTSIRGFVQFLQGSTDPKEWREYGDIIVREVDGLNRIVSELLDLVRSRPLHAAPTELNQLVRDILLLARDCARAGRVEFVVDLAEGLPQVEVDPGELKQVLLNVVVNAIQSLAGGEGTVCIVSARHPAGVALSVADNGCGMPAAARERIFEPFFSTKPAGTGLGMAIARRIIERHKGSIEIESEEGLGTTVTLILPPAPSTPETPEIP